MTSGLIRGVECLNRWRCSVVSKIFNNRRRSGIKIWFGRAGIYKHFSPSQSKSWFCFKHSLFVSLPTVKLLFIESTVLSLFNRNEELANAWKEALWSGFAPSIAFLFFYVTDLQTSALAVSFPFKFNLQIALCFKLTCFNTKTSCWYYSQSKSPSISKSLTLLLFWRKLFSQLSPLWLVKERLPLFW